jgi:hypothetical protein
MKSRHTALFAVILALPVAAGGDRNQLASQPDVPALSQGMVLTIDAAGKFSPNAPMTTDLRTALGEALSTSSEGLVEEKNSLPGGGYVSDLQGRFQNAVIVEKDADGNLIAPCVTGTHTESTAGEVE